jgi:hypothetical protein
MAYSGRQSSGDLKNARMSVCEALAGDRLLAILCPVWHWWLLLSRHDPCIFWNRDCEVVSCSDRVNFCSVMEFPGGFLLNCDRYLQTCLLVLALQGFQAALAIQPLMP